jgi:hypothetical protein
MLWRPRQINPTFALIKVCLGIIPAKIIQRLGIEVYVENAEGSSSYRQFDCHGICLRNSGSFHHAKLQTGGAVCFHKSGGFCINAKWKIGTPF